MSAISAFCDVLRTDTGAAVFLGYPDDAVPGVYVWPWRVDDSASWRRTTRPLMSGPPQAGAVTEPTSESPDADVSFLVLVRPALTPAGIANLDAVRRAIHAHPVLEFEGGKALVEPSLLSREDLTNLFRAADMPLSICVSGMLRGITGRAD